MAGLRSVAKRLHAGPFVTLLVDRIGSSRLPARPASLANLRHLLRCPPYRSRCRLTLGEAVPRSREPAARAVSAEQVGQSRKLPFARNEALKAGWTNQAVEIVRCGHASRAHHAVLRSAEVSWPDAKCSPVAVYLPRRVDNAMATEEKFRERSLRQYGTEVVRQPICNS